MPDSPLIGIAPQVKLLGRSVGPIAIAPINVCLDFAALPPAAASSAGYVLISINLRYCTIVDKPHGPPGVANPRVTRREPGNEAKVGFNRLKTSLEKGFDVRFVDLTASADGFNQRRPVSTGARYESTRFLLIPGFSRSLVL